MQDDNGMRLSLFFTNEKVERKILTRRFCGKTGVADEQ